MDKYRPNDRTEADTTVTTAFKRRCRSPSKLELESGDVHVVLLRLEQELPGAGALLDETERARADRFAFEPDRHRFVTAHAWVRIVLGRCLEQAPESLRFTAGPRGKPRLVDTAVDLRFNLSHAGERALLAVTRGQEVGVDIEQERPMGISVLARRFFAPLEWQALQAMEASEQIPAFFRCWTRKEAFIKAIGDGLACPLGGFEVSLAEDESPQLLRSCTAVAGALERWRIVSVPVEPGYRAAVAAGPGEWRIVRWTDGERVSEAV
jgi:4'-phosphopantetheinyl transferase